MIADAEKYHADLIRRTGEDPRHPKVINDPRITRVGRWIRRFSIDEVPQIWNILRGEMSWVGPRPATPDEVDLYEPWHLQRLRVLPGLTGLWQVSGRSEVPFEEMCLLDIYYIENWSLTLGFADYSADRASRPLSTRSVLIVLPVILSANLNSNGSPPRNFTSSPSV